MTNLFNYAFLQKLFQLSFFILVIILILLLILLYFSKTFNFQTFGLSNSIFTLSKYLSVFSLVLLSILVLFFSFYFVFFFKYQSFYVFSECLVFLPTIYLVTDILKYTYVFSIDFFGLMLLCLAIVVGFLSLLVLDTRLYWKNTKYVIFLNLFTIIVYLLITTSNIVLFFLFYELLLLPSALFVYYVSPNRRAIQATLYFIIWTQLGSFLVLCVVSYVVIITNAFNFNNLFYYNFSNMELNFIHLFLFLGFGFKIPIWPFHFWLTKTHVEAPSGFSIYLSGFLVKSALYGYYKFISMFGLNLNTVVYSVIVSFGVLDASLKMWGQTDLKKLVAYGTIQEMNMIFLALMLGDTYSLIIVIFFAVTHAFLSAIMFFLVDCIYRRYHTRSVVLLSGLFQITPNLGLSILFMCVFFSGLPGTMKFTSEFYLFVGYTLLSPISCFLLMFTANVLGLIGFSKAWYNVTFGSFVFFNKYTTIPLDLTAKEIYILFFCFFSLFFGCYASIFNF